MKLFTLIDYKVHIEPEALLLAPFATIWERDKSENKKRAMMELSYIWFMWDIKSDFFDVIDEKERAKDVREALQMPASWKPDTKVKAAGNFYGKTSETLAFKLLLDSRSGLGHLSKLLKNPDFDKIDIKKVADTIKALPQLIDALKKLENSVLKEQEVIHHKGSQERAMFEDGL